jgi:hypothetical protein
MLLVTSKPLPSTPELAEVLKRELPSHYFYELYLERESILVSKSTSVKAHISTHENQILVQAFISSSLFASIIGFLCMTELGLILIPIFYHKGTQLLSQKDEFEKELSLYLEYKYNASQFNN